MLEGLDEASHQSRDPPDAVPLIVTHRMPTGCRGRPRVEVDPAFLSQALTLRGSTQISAVLQCSPRTVRRRALELGLADPAPPVFMETLEADGTITQTHTSTTRPVSTLSDEELDAEVAAVLQVFPSFGRRLLAGRLQAAGHHVPRVRLAASYLRVHGPSGLFGLRTIQRREYNVAGANSLWHHDGQHGKSLSTDS